MSCSTCKEVIDPDIPFAEFDYTPNARFAQQAFIKLPQKPARGWTVVLPLKGSPQQFTGVNPHHVAAAALRLYKLNGFQVDKNALWFNMNIQWLGRTHAKYHTIPLKSLMEAAQPNIVVNEDSHALKKMDITAAKEGLKAFLNAYTQSETYRWETFYGFLKEYGKMLNPAENALLGNSVMYVRFTLALDKIERNPAYDGQKAKDWLNENFS